MGDEYGRRVITEGFGLGGSGLFEFLRGDINACDAPSFQINNIVHTARGTGPSIRQGFDHHLALRSDLLFKFEGGHLGEGRFLIP